MNSFSSLVALLAERARSQASERAYIFLSDRGSEEAALTYGELYDAARALAARLTKRVQPGERALLVFPPGLEFMVAFFGCLMARVIAVPMMMPRRNSARDSSAAILANCEPAVALTTSAFTLRQDLQARFAHEGLQWLAVDLTASEADEAGLPLPDPQTVAFVQYTSGSTSDPKGVAVTHANLLANLEMIRISLGNTRQSTYVNWVPLYHDMGLILNALQALYVGALCVLMAPNAFMQRPLNWLRAIHQYRAEVACSPNFGYDLCVSRYRAEQMEDIDLSSWKVALNGAEPVRRDTIRKFADTFAAHGFQLNATFPAWRHGRSDASDLRWQPRRADDRADREPERAAGASSGAAGRWRRRADAGRLRPRFAGRTDRHRRSRQPGPPARQPGRRNLGQRAEYHARLLAQRVRRPKTACMPTSRVKTPRHRGCAPAISASSMRTASCSSPDGSRT